jgi:hypothetical protein
VGGKKALAESITRARKVSLRRYAEVVGDDFARAVSTAESEWV